MTSEHRTSYPRHTDAAPVASPNLPAIEQRVLASWLVGDTFRKSVEARPAGEDGSNEFVFYDGPPFANGLPHYGHLLTGYVKDVVPRYQTMRGRRVERRFGWDTHGLPAELEAERILGITDKSQIEEMGIEAFNAACRESVLAYTKEWEDYVTRQARWVDFANDYKTLDPSFMESVLWAFKQLYDKGLAYEGFRVLPYCWRDQTPLSNHELRMDDDVYQMRQDPALTVGLPFAPALDSGVDDDETPGLSSILDGTDLLVWTTTPWTLPAHQAVAVNPSVTYVVVEPAPESQLARANPGMKVLLASARLAAYARELGEDPRVVAELAGADLVGRRYFPPFPFFANSDDGGAPDDNPACFQIIAADFVTTDDGTGLVHLAPAFGEDDMLACEALGITPVVTVGDAGEFTALVPDYAGVQVFEANPQIIADLKAGAGPLAATPADRRPVVVRHETYDHSYPHCWRCRNPLIYKAVSSWFVRVTQFRDRMVELNEQIDWTPEHIKHGQFGKWLAGARDWSISRNRYWGTPIPVWVSDDPAYPRIDVYGSFDELARDFGDVPRNDAGEPDLHRPWIDRLTRPNPDDPSGQATMRRIPDVLDVWFDSGSMPFAQVHYPFENTDWFEHHYPGDFIVEYIGQTRGWFYTLHVLATALFDRPAFRSAISHGIVLGSDGRKMSKSLRNYPDVTEVLDRDGSDAMRWFLMSSPILRGGNLVVTEEGIRAEVRGVLLPLWNAWYFFALYAGTLNGGAGYLAQPVAPEAVADLPEMDRYLLARTHDLAVAVTQAADAYDVAAACQLIRDHIDLLTNWYVRTQRDRFWAEDTRAFDTLYTALEALTRIMAPFAPLITEEIWRGLTGGESVHLTDWLVDREGQVEPALVADPELVAAMDRVREVVSTAHALRKANKVRVRQPLRSLAVVLTDGEEAAAFAPFADLVASEVNLKDVTLEDLASDAAARYGVETRLTVNARALGPRLGRKVQEVIKAARAGEWTQEGESVLVAGERLFADEGEYELVTQAAGGGDGELAVAVLPSGGFVVLDLALDDALRAEGFARDVVRQVQDARKAADLHVSDRIALRLGVPGDRAGDAEAWRDDIARETLATSIAIEPVDPAELAKGAVVVVDLSKDLNHDTEARA